MSHEVLKRTKLRRIHEEFKIKRWKWKGHVLRLEDDNDCTTASTWKPEGRRKVGRPRTVEKDGGEGKSWVGYLGTKSNQLPETEGARKSPLQPDGLQIEPEEDMDKKIKQP